MAEGKGEAGTERDDGMAGDGACLLQGMSLKMLHNQSLLLDQVTPPPHSFNSDSVEWGGLGAVTTRSSLPQSGARKNPLNPGLRTRQIQGSATWCLLRTCRINYPASESAAGVKWPKRAQHNNPGQELASINVKSERRVPR